MSWIDGHLDLAYLARRRGEPERVASYLDKAYEHRERLPERQKLAVEAQFAGIRGLCAIGLASLRLGVRTCAGAGARPPSGVNF